MKVKLKVAGFLNNQNLYMINTQFKFEAKIPNGSNVHKKLHKSFKFQGQFDLEGQGHQFSKSYETFR